MTIRWLTLCSLYSPCSFRVSSSQDRHEVRGATVNDRLFLGLAPDCLFRYDASPHLLWTISSQFHSSMRDYYDFTLPNIILLPYPSPSSPIDSPPLARHSHQPPNGNPNPHRRPINCHPSLPLPRTLIPHRPFNDDPNALAQRPIPDTTSNPPEGTLTPACMSCSDGRARGERRGGDALEDHDPATKPRTWVRISDRPGYRASVARRRDGCGQVISSCRRHSTHCIANDDGRGDPSGMVHALHDRV